MENPVNAPIEAAPSAGEPLPQESAQASATLRAIMMLLFYQGYTVSINSFASPWIAKSFGLDQAGIARIFAWIGFSALGSFALSRLVDRSGRRRVVLWCLAATPVCTMGAALSTDLIAFTAFEIALYAFLNATFAACIVMLAEQMPLERRAEGQSRGGLAAGLGGGACALLTPIVISHGLSWRWLLWIATAGAALLPIMRNAITESARWQDVAATGMQARTHFYDVFVPLYRKRSTTLIVTSLLSTVAMVAIQSWSYFHMVTVVKLSPGLASAVTLIGGGGAMLGFRAGARASERFGRVRTVATLGAVISAGSLFFYWGPPAHFPMPALWVGIGFCWMLGSSNAGMVATNTAVTELFPTALRATMMGWFAITGAIASIASQATISILAPRMGGLSIVAGALSILLLPSALLFGLMIDETRGLSLEAAANEDAFRTSGS